MEIEKFVVYSLWIYLVRLQTLLNTCPQRQQKDTNRHVEDLIMTVRKQADQLQDFNTKLKEIQSHSYATDKILRDHEAAITAIMGKALDKYNVSANGTNEFMAAVLRAYETYLRTGPNCMIDLIFMVDSSSSNCWGESFNERRLDLFKNVLEAAAIDSGKVRVGFLTYGSESRIEFQLNRYFRKQDLFNAIDKLNCTGGNTNMADALATVRNVMFKYENGDRPNVSNIVILITDGFSNINSSRTIQEADKTKENNIQIFAIGIELWNRDELLSIASKPTWKHAYDIYNNEDMNELGPHIHKVVCEGSNPPT